MATEITLPRLGQGMESGTIVRWLKSEGDSIEKGEPLYELDTEKVTQEVEAEQSGVLLRIVAQEGEEIEVGRLIAVVGEEGEELPELETAEVAMPAVAFVDAEVDGATEAAEAPDQEAAGAAAVASAQTGSPSQEQEPPPAAATLPAPAAPTGPGGERIKASPLARRIAKERGIDLALVTGTGPDGRIVAEDVERAAAAPPAPAAPAAPAPPVEIETVKLTGIRRTIARRMTESWQSPHFQISMSADMRPQIHLRERLVEQAPEGGVKPTYSDILTKLCALALMRHREVNALFAEGEIHLYPTANIGIAVAIPNGLVVPVIPSCEVKSIPEIATVRADLVERARAGKLESADLEGGTFTISNLGMYGVERFAAILNPPQAAILAVGAILERAVVEDGEIVARPIMDLTVSCDHRSIDGVTGAEFLSTVRDFVEEPGLAL